MPTTVDYERMLRGANLRVTRPRMAVLDAIHEHPHGVTNSIVDAVHEADPAVSRQAVYDVLRALTEAGLVRRIEPAAPLPATSRGSATTTTTSSAAAAAGSPTSTVPSARPLA